MGLIAVGMVSPAPQAQSAGAPQSPQRPVFRSDVNFIMVDAYPLVDGQVVEGLTAADFEVREDGRPQRIESFEYVRADERLTEGTRREPGNQRQMMEELADPRTRAFVVYLDTHHLGMRGTYAGAYYSREPIVELFQRVLAPGDLIALATSRNHPRQMTFGRRSDVVEQQLTDWWTLQDPDVTVNDAEELTMTTCFPSDGTAGNVAHEWIARRRQDQLLSSLEGTVEYLGEVREGRKTMFLFSHGWTLFKPNPDLLAPLNSPNRVPPKGPPIVREPWQQMRVGTALWEGSAAACELELIRLANLDSLPRFQKLLRDAALNNVAIYPVNPGGTGAIGGGNDRLMELASNTGGTPIVNRNDLVQGVIDVSREFEGYYLLGYASDNQKADGSLRRIEVTVSRPGITVKARQGYRALSKAEAANKAEALAAPVVVDDGRAALDAAFDVLVTIRPGDDGAFNLARYLKADAAPYLGVPTVSRATPSPRSPIVPVNAPAFRRNERLHIEWPVTQAFDSASGRVLGRDGKPLAVQVAITERVDGAARILVGDVVLGPLASGDFVVELTVVSGDTSTRTLVAFRVVS